MRGKTPVLSGDEMRQLLDSIDTSELIAPRMKFRSMKSNESSSK
jgi:hypothetical protein